MSTPSRVTRSQSRAMSQPVRGSQEPIPAPTPGRAGSRAASTKAGKKGGGLAPKASSAYGGAPGSAAADRTSAAEGAAGFAAGFSEQREEALRLTPVREEQEEVVDLAPPVLMNRERSTRPVVSQQRATGSHGSTIAMVAVCIFAVTMGLVTALAGAKLALPFFGYELVPCGGDAGAAPSVTQLYGRLYSDLYKALWGQLSRNPPPTALGKPAEKLPDALDHNQLGLHYVDYFSFHRGAIINPFLTSDSAPMAGEQIDVMQEELQQLPWYSPTRWVGTRIKRDTTRWPVEAIIPWTEAGQCWCAKETAEPPYHRNLESQQSNDRIWFAENGGIGDPRSLSLPGSPRAQLSLVMPQAIYPSHAIIEHIPPQGTSDIRSAPEWIELWAQVSNEDDNNRVWDAYSTASGERVRPWPEYTQEDISTYGSQVKDTTRVRAGWLYNKVLSWFRDDDEDETKQIPYAGKLALGATWVRVARYRYDIHAANHAQKIKIPVDFKQLEIPVRKMTARVRSNYGQDYTCMYRVRMLGELAEQQ